MAKQSKLLQKVNNALASGRYENAIANLTKLIAEDSTNIEYLLLMGESLMRNEQFIEAVQYFAKVVESDSSNIRALNNLGAGLVRIRQLDKAKEILLYALELDPNNIDIYTNLGSVYQGLAQPEKSLEIAFKVIELNPSWYMAYNNLGCALGDLMLVNEAKEAYKTAVALNPNYVPAIINLAQLEIKSGNQAQGLELYESILKLKNITNGERDLVKYYLSHSYLYFGDIAKGWDYYDYGFSSLLPSGAYRSLRKFKQPFWNGDIEEKKTILIWREQGLGDEILFSTCLRDVHETNLNVILECDPRLIGIFQRTYPKFKVRGESVDEDHFSNFNDFDFQLAIGSLPKYFRRNISDFEIIPTVWKPLPNTSANIKERLEPYQDKILIGICWRSGKLSIERNLHYTALQDWQPLLINPNYQFVNLVHGNCDAEISEVEKMFGIHILRWTDIDLKNDMETVLALVSELDCVVSIGSAASIIAGASGINTLVLLQQSWVLLGQPEKYHWFPNVKPFIPADQDHVGVNIKNLNPYIIKKM
jgi:tetratricopeptide (TPR) repeat protein